MFRQLFLKKKYSLQMGVALLIALLTFVVPTASASAHTIVVKQAAGEIAPQCEIFQEEVSKTESEIAILTAELNGADFSERSVIAHEILQQTNLENKELAELNACVTANPGLPPLNAKLTGSITFSISSDGFQEHTVPITVGIVFSPFRDQVNFSLPSVNVPGFPVSVTESAISTGTGTFNKTTGAMTEPTELLFDIHAPVANSTGDFTFTTGDSVAPDGGARATGVPLNPQSGGINLVATTKFNNGALSGVDAVIFIIGTITPLP